MTETNPQNECVFCKIVAKELPSYLIKETENFLVFLDINPISEGHALIISKMHYKNFLELPSSLFQEYEELTQSVAKKIMHIVEADGINIGMNIGKAAGQIIFHAHTHIIPRFADDGHGHWPRLEIGKDHLTQVQNKLKKVLK
jgi:histidine triad (HIT) family protein